MTENAPGWKPLADRREQFLEAISSYSEDRWAAGWLLGIEEQVRVEAGLWLRDGGGLRGLAVGLPRGEGLGPADQRRSARC